MSAPARLDKWNSEPNPSVICKLQVTNLSVWVYRWYSDHTSVGGTQQPIYKARACLLTFQKFQTKRGGESGQGYQKIGGWIQFLLRGSLTFPAMKKDFWGETFSDEYCFFTVSLFFAPSWGWDSSGSVLSCCI